MLLSVLDLPILLGIAAGKTQAEIGEELNLEQPAISKLLHACEARTELRLVEQRGRRIGLTPAGEELARAAHRTLAAFQEVDRLASALRAGSRGTLRLIASSTPGSYVLPEIVARFLETHPEATVKLEILPINALWQSFERDDYDFAVVPLRGLPAELAFEPLYSDPVVFFVARESPLARREQLEVPELGAEIVIGQFVASHWKDIVRGLEPRGFASEEELVIRSPEAVKRIVLSGFGVGVLLESSIRRDLEIGRLVRLPINDPSLREPICLAYRPDRMLSPIAEEFRAFLHAAVRH